ncbi:MAG TPA: class I SAM-dependent methyltransferase [Gemmatimonadales bacterium]
MPGAAGGRVFELREQDLSFDQVQVIGRKLHAAPWRFAKTMPKDPHEYTLRQQWNDGTFDEVVHTMRAHGYDELYRGRYVRGLLNLNGRKYWTMGAPVPATILINRKVNGGPAPYDAIAPLYDDVFHDDASLRENELVMTLVGDLSGQDVLDIGCGTGLLLDYQRPAGYLGIDPSHGMLDHLLLKHATQVLPEVIACRLEEFVAPREFDVAVCLFGSANYIRPDFLEAIPQLARRWVVMFMREGYEPETYRRTGHRAKHYPGMHAKVPGVVTQVGEHIVVRGRR